MGELSFRKFNRKKDIPTMEAWLAARGSEYKVELDFMPPTGIVVEMDGKPVCLGFMICCDNGMVINSDFVSDPTLEKPVRNAAVQFMRATLYRTARERGFKFVTAFTRIPKLDVHLRELGFMEIDKGLTQLGRFLWP